MKSTASLVTCLLVAALPLGAQNLVPNGSFEDYAQCPTNLDQMNRAVGWSSVRGSCDYYNACADPDTVGVPDNCFGYQSAFSGSAMAGAFCFSTDDGNPLDLRECFGTQLIAPMIIGQTYHASLRVSLTTEADCGTGGLLAFACNRMGLLFTVAPFFQTDFDNVPGYAHVYATSIVSDSIGWVTISGSVMADSAYEYVVGGNFFNDATTAWDSIEPTGTHGYAYYYFDDICVSPNPNDCATAEGIEDQQSNSLFLHPNPAVDHVILTSTKPGSAFASVVLLDASGRSVPVQVERHAGRELTVRWAQPLAPGVYLLRAALKSGERFTERVVVE